MQSELQDVVHQDQGEFEGQARRIFEPSDVTEQQLMDEMIMINDAKREVC